MTNNSSMEIHKKKRNTRQTKNQIDQTIEKIIDDLVNHTGYPVLFIQKEGRDMVPYLVWIDSKSGRLGVVAHHNCYHPDGGLRCKTRHIIDAIKVMTGEQIVIYFDEDI